MLSFYRHVLVATDFSPLADVALERAAEIALGGKARLTLAHVLVEPTIPSPYFSHFDVEIDAERREKARAEAKAALVAKVPRAVRDAELSVAIEIATGDPADEILAIAERLQPDVIVLATHGRRGFERWILGSVAERVLRSATVDVMIVRPRKQH